VDLELLRSRYRGFDWIPVTIGASAASVFRLEGPAGALYLKALGAGAHVNATLDLQGEADRLHWLRECNIPVPEVVELVTGAEVDYLVTRALPGASAADVWPADQRSAVVDAVADLLRTLHALPVASCPFDRSLAITMAAARRAVELSTVDLDDLDPERSGWTGEQLLTELEATVPASEDLAVGHGDYCLPNVVVDPETMRVSGLVDVGRVGRADRHLDLALMTRSLSSPLNPSYGPAHAQRFLSRYAEPGNFARDIDAVRLDFYRLLDEFC
jgi:kanamycin kinase